MNEILLILLAGLVAAAIVIPFGHFHDKWKKEMEAEDHYQKEKGVKNERD